MSNLWLKMYIFVYLISFNMIIGLNGLNEIFKLENINLKQNKNNYVVWEDTSNNGNNNHVIITSEYLGINDYINGYCVSKLETLLSPIIVPIDISPNTYPNLTIIAWVYKYNVSSNTRQWIISNGNGDIDGAWDRAILFNDQGAFGGFAIGAGVPYSSTIDYLTPNEWTFVAAVYTDSGTASIYKGQNGSLISQTIPYNNNNNGRNYFRVNGHPDGGRGRNFIGCISQVEIYSDALSNDDIQQRFDNMNRAINIIPTNTPTIEPTIEPSIAPTIQPTIQPETTTTEDNIESRIRMLRMSFRIYIYNCVS